MYLQRNIILNINEISKFILYEWVNKYVSNFIIDVPLILFLRIALNNANKTDEGW